jgi:hypothetical protein
MTAHYLKLDRNLHNYPLARDGHLRTHWRKSAKTGRWVCDFGETLTIRLPADVDAKHKRWPTAFDMNVLFALLREAQVTRSPTITPPSRSSLLRRMGVAKKSSNYRRLEDAIALWQVLSVRFINGYVSRGEERGFTWPPPIQSMRSGRLTINRKWLPKTYYTRVALPLPGNAPAQNLVLWLHTAIRRGAADENGVETTKRRKRLSLCWTIGVAHNNRQPRLLAAIAAAEQWYERQGGELRSMGNGLIAFSIRSGVKNLTKTVKNLTSTTRLKRFVTHDE